MNSILERAVVKAQQARELLSSIGSNQEPLPERDWKLTGDGSSTPAERTAATVSWNKGWGKWGK